jgi:hypothetical protein
MKEKIMKVKVLWLSRHPMTAEQLADLEAHPHMKVGFSSEQKVVLEMVQHNMMYPAIGYEAAEKILDVGSSYGANIIAGVFPAHVAVQLCRRNKWANAYTANTLKGVMVPVSMPAPAVEGETRGGGFVHSHWEVF